jgi:hypothetical protein
MSSIYVCPSPTFISNLLNDFTQVGRRQHQKFPDGFYVSLRRINAFAKHVLASPIYINPLQPRIQKQKRKNEKRKEKSKVRPSTWHWAQKGELKYSSTLTSASDRGGLLTPRPLPLYSRWITWYTLYRVSLRTGVDRCGKPRPQLGFDPPTFQLVASRYNDYSTHYGHKPHP